MRHVVFVLTMHAIFVLAMYAISCADPRDRRIDHPTLDGGEPCSRDEECGDAECIRWSHRHEPGRHCYRACDLADGPDANGCAVCSEAPGWPVCVPDQVGAGGACYMPSDCADGYACVDGVCI